MAELKTKENDGDVTAFLAGVPDAQRRADAQRLLGIFRRVTKEPPRMWGASMVGYGRYHYTYATGREGDWFIAGFSPRKQDLTVYLMCGFEPLAADLARLGKHKLGKSCLYVKRLDDIDPAVLERMLKTCFKHVAEHQGCGSGARPKKK